MAKKIRTPREKRIKQSEILSKSWYQFASMSRDEVYKYAKSASQLAKERRTKLINNLIEKNLPVPLSLQKWRTRKSFASDKFNQQPKNLEEVIGFNSYDRGYGNVDFSISPSMSKNELLHKLNLATRFIKAETSTAGGWEKYYNKIIKRISEKANIEITADQYADYWKLYNQVKDIMQKNSIFSGKFDHGRSEQAQQDIAKYMLDNGFNLENATELALVLEAQWREEYESEEDDDSGKWL